MTPLELLDEAGGLPAFELPEQLAELYGGTLGFDEPRVFANFVETADGVVAIPSVPLSNKLIADGSAADRFVMGLLRACADVVVVGSGTMSDSPGGLWTAAQAYPGRGGRVRRAARAPRPSARARGGGAHRERRRRSGASGLRARRARPDDGRGRGVPGREDRRRAA